MPKSQEQIILDLRDELDEAREVIRQLNAQLRGSDKVSATIYTQAFHLTKTEALVFSLLMARDFISKSTLIGIVWPDKDICLSLVACLVHKIRRKMLPLDVVVDLVHGEGYLILPPMKRRVKKLVEEWDAAGQPSRLYRLQHQHRNSSVVQDHG